MLDWNVVATVREGGFRDAARLLEAFGPVSRTDYFNVLVLRTGDIAGALERLREQLEREPGIGNFLARFVPLARTFAFQSAREFEAKAAEIVAGWVPELSGKRFHVRMCRRGFKGRLSSMDEERFLDERLLGLLEEAGAPGRITFADPDAVIAIETVGPRGGLSLWTREDLARYPFLGVD